MNADIVSLSTRGTADVRLVCFAFAGGAASSFQPWLRSLRAGVELAGVQLPGRENLAHHPFITDFRPLLAAVVTAVRSAIDGPFALFGHSLGALLAFETARALRRERVRQPLALAVAGARAPHVASTEPPLGDAPEEVFLAKMREYGGTPDGVLTREKVARHFLPRLRADHAVFESYRYEPQAPLSVPVLALGGADDRVAPAHLLAGWREQTSATCLIESMPGAHFFIHQAREAVVHRACSFLATCARRGA